MLLDLDLKDNIPVSLKISTLKTTGVKTVLMSTYSEPAVVREALGAGALGYLVKSEPVEMIVEAIRAAARGDSSPPSSSTRSPTTAARPSSAPRSAGSWRSTAVASR